MGHCCDHSQLFCEKYQGTAYYTLQEEQMSEAKKTTEHRDPNTVRRLFRSTIRTRILTICP